jgi:hypothetical protein
MFSTSSLAQAVPYPVFVDKEIVGGSESAKHVNFGMHLPSWCMKIV